MVIYMMGMAPQIVIWVSFTEPKWRVRSNRRVWRTGGVEVLHVTWSVTIGVTLVGGIGRFVHEGARSNGCVRELPKGPEYLLPDYRGPAQRWGFVRRGGCRLSP